MANITYGSIATPLMPDSPGANNLTVQTEVEVKAVRMVQKLFHRAKRYRKRVDKDWHKFYEFGLRNRHWPAQRPAFRASPVSNYIWSVIQTIVPIATDGKPSPGVMPENPDDVVFAEFLRKAIQWYWQDAGCDQEITTSMYDACIYGTGILRVGFDPELRQGLGDIVLEAVDPMYCFPDPDATSIENARYFIYAVPTPVSEVKRKFGERAKVVGGDFFFDLEAFDTRYASQDVILTSPVDKRTSYTKNDYLRGADNEERVLWLECWLNDQTTEEVEIEDEETGETKKELRKKYPNGRVLTVVGNTLLQDAHNPFADGMIPFATYSDYVMPREFWGQGEVEQLRQMQEDLNRMDAIIYEGSALMSNGIWLVQSGSVKDVDNLTNQQGLIVEYTGQRPERERGPGVPEHLFKYRDQKVRDINIVSGINDVSRGVRPEGIEAGVAIEQLKESDRTRIRLKVRNLERALKRVGKLIVSRMMQYYTEPRMIQLAGEGNKGPEYFYFHFEQGNDGNPVGIVQPTTPSQMVTGPTGQPTVQPSQPGQQQPYPVKGWFDVRFNVTSALPFTKQQLIINLEKFIKLLQVDPGAQNPLLDLYAEALEIPGAQEVIDKIRANYQPPPQGPALEPPKVSVAAKLEYLPPEWQHAILQQGGIQLPGEINTPPTQVPAPPPTNQAPPFSNGQPQGPRTQSMAPEVAAFGK